MLRSIANVEPVAGCKYVWELSFNNKRLCLSSKSSAFAVAGPMTWNALPTQLRRLDVTTAAFGRFLKTVMFSEY